MTPVFVVMTRICTEQMMLPLNTLWIMTVMKSALAILVRCVEEGGDCQYIAPVLKIEKETNSKNII